MEVRLRGGEDPVGYGVYCVVKELRVGIGYADVGDEKMEVLRE